MVYEYVSALLCAAIIGKVVYFLHVYFLHVPVQSCRLRSVRGLVNDQYFLLFMVWYLATGCLY
jgi:hypothetical protein